MPTVHYDVDMVSQQFSPVCWLGCAVMIYQYKRRATPPTSWLDVTGDDFRHPGYTVDPPIGGVSDQYARLRRMGFTTSSSTSFRSPAGRTMVARRAGPPSMAGRVALQARTPSSSEHADAERIHLILREVGPFMLFHHVGAFSYGPGIGALANPEGRDLHAVVITGVETERNRVYFNNPWGNKDVTTTATSITAAMTRFERQYPHSVIHMAG